LVLSKLSIVIPALNEESGIGCTIDEIPVDKLALLGYTTEIIVVDGNSSDNTVGIAKSRGAIVVVEPRRGYGRAYKTGFQSAHGDYIATLDADGTYPAEMIPSLLSKLVEDNLDLISTNRFACLDDGAMSLSHRLGNKVLSSVGRFFFRIPIIDSQSGMWVFKRSLLNIVSVSSDGMGFSQEFKIRSFQNAVCRELPIYYRRRVGEVKLGTFRDGLKNLREMIGLIWTPEGEALLGPKVVPLPNNSIRLPLIEEDAQRVSASGASNKAQTKRL
jgi:glycosyltransferase involved in cell wall biosynthesis